MKINKLKKKLEQGHVALNGWLHIPNTWTAEVMAHAGWDSITIDGQHGLPDVQTGVQMMQAISTTDTVPLFRVSWNDPALIMRVLDGGSYGVICPMINDAKACEKFVQACHYPPLGYRSFGPIRARVYAGDDYAQYANEEILTIAMIETKQAIENIDSILSTKGLNAILVGSNDLRLSFSASVPQNEVNDQYENALDTILKSCKKNGIIPGIWCASAAIAKSMIAKGFRLVSIASDSMLLQQATSQLVQEMNTKK